MVPAEAGMLKRALDRGGVAEYSFLNSTLYLCHKGYKLTPDSRSEQLLGVVDLCVAEDDKLKAIGLWERAVREYYERESGREAGRGVE